MPRRDVEFDSDGTTVRGWLYTPEDGTAPYPTVIMAGGWCYVKEIVMPEIAERFVEEGVACLLFDYRNFGESDVHDTEQHVDPWAQIEDYQNAVSFAELQDDVDEDRLGAWGISYSGGHAIILAAIESRVQCVVSNIPVTDGLTQLRLVHNEEDFHELQELLVEDRRKRFRGEEPGTMRMSVTDPGTTDFSETPYTWGVGDIEEPFMELKETVAPNHEHWNTIESVELLCRYSVFPFLDHIRTPVKMIAATDEHLHMADRQVEAFDGIHTKDKEYFKIPDTTHMTLYSDKSHTQIMAEEGATWFDEWLGRDSR